MQVYMKNYASKLKGEKIIEGSLAKTFSFNQKGIQKEKNSSNYCEEWYF